MRVNDIVFTPLAKREARGTESCLGDKVTTCPRCSAAAYKRPDESYKCFECGWEGK